jgi:hypothetical protein
VKGKFFKLECFIFLLNEFWGIHQVNTAKPVGSACLCNALYRDTCNALHRYKKAWHKSIHRAIHFPRHFSSHRDIVTLWHRYTATSLHCDIATSLVDRKKNLTKLNAVVPRSDSMQQLQNIKKKQRRE